MIAAIDVDDAGWDQVPALEALAGAAIAAATLATRIDPDSVSVELLFTGDAAIATLNAHWRGKDDPTNVLSFPAGEFPVPAGEPRPIGDIVLAWGVVAREAGEQGKTLPQHTAHLIVHGLLHLLGHDHDTDEKAQRMESLEADILKGLGISNPYDRQ